MRRNRFLWTVCGFALLVLIGASACTFPPVVSHASAKTSHLSQEVAFTPSGSMPGLHPGIGHTRPKALRPAASQPRNGRATPCQMGLCDTIDKLEDQRLELRSTVEGAMMGNAAGMTCPSTAAFGPAAGMQVTTSATTSCDNVEAEIKARVNGQSNNAWYDPHNKGKYTLESYGGTLSTSRLTGNGLFTDRQIFTLTPDADNCMIQACSRSQGTSLLDMGTNYCNLKMLFCGTADGCKPLVHDFTVGTETTKAFAQASVDLKQCLVV